MRVFLPIAALIVTFMLGGCATSLEFPLANEIRSVPTPRFRLVDQRSERDKTAENFGGPNKYGCMWGVYRIGDSQTQPNRISLLISVMEQQLGQQLAGKDILLKRFEIYNNAQSTLAPDRLKLPYPPTSKSMPSSGAATPAALGVPLPTSGVDVAGQAIGIALVGAMEEAMKPSSCSEFDQVLATALNPGNWPSAIAHVEVEVDSMRAASTAVEFEPFGMVGREGTAIAGARMGRAVQTVIDDVVRKLSARQR